MANKPEDDPRIYLSAEMSLLAWLRTGFELMVAGFAVARFGLFLHETQTAQSHSSVHASELSVWSGVALVLLGVVVNISALVRHVQVVRKLRTGTWKAGKVSVSAVALVLVLASGGVGMAVYLVLAH